MRKKNVCSTQAWHRRWQWLFRGLQSKNRLRNVLRKELLVDEIKNEIQKVIFNKIEINLLSEAKIVV